MKIMRSTKLSLKFCNQRKITLLNSVLKEYGTVVNHFIALFWKECPSKGKLLKAIVNYPDTWLCARLRKVAAREAIDMVRANRERDKDKAVMPVHAGRCMCVSSTIAALVDGSKAFDGYIILRCIGNGIKLNLPVNFHRHLHSLKNLGRRCESYIITDKYIQLAFEIETGLKKRPDSCVGIDTGINSLASLSNGEQLGTDIKSCIERIKRCKHGSKGQKRASKALRQRMNEVAKQIAGKFDLVVVENLKNITKNTKRRLGKNMRRTIGRWNIRYWLTRLQMACEMKRCSFRTVCAGYTSQTCSACGYTDRKNRTGEVFHCLKCSHRANADVQASVNILQRFLTGPYGAGCKPACSIIT